MPATTPELSIIIISYNTRRLLEECLHSLERITGEVPFEIIVADNASPDGSADSVAEYFPDVRLIRLPENRGFAAAINAARTSALGSFLFILNPDTLVAPGTLERLTNFMREHPRVAVVGAGITDARGRDLPSDFGFPTLFREFWNFIPEVKYVLLNSWPAKLLRGSRDKSLKPRQVIAVSGAAMMIRKDALDAVGGFDDRFFLYHEEVDLCARLFKEGFEIWSLPAAQVIHFDAQASGYSSKRLPTNPVLEWRVLGMERLFRKHHSRKTHRAWVKMAARMLKLRGAFATKHRAQELRDVAGKIEEKFET